MQRGRAWLERTPAILPCAVAGRAMDPRAVAAALVYLVLTTSLYVWSDDTGAPLFLDVVFVGLLLGLSVLTGAVIARFWALLLPAAVFVGFAVWANTGTQGDTSVLVIVALFFVASITSALGIAAGVIGARRLNLRSGVTARRS